MIERLRPTTTLRVSPVVPRLVAAAGEPPRSVSWNSSRRRSATRAHSAALTDLAHHLRGSERAGSVPRGALPRLGDPDGVRTSGTIARGSQGGRAERGDDRTS